MISNPVCKYFWHIVIRPDRWETDNIIVFSLSVASIRCSSAPVQNITSKTCRTCSSTFRTFGVESTSAVFNAGWEEHFWQNSHLYKLISDIVNLKCPRSLITPAWSWTWPGWRLSGSTFPLCLGEGGINFVEDQIFTIT